MVDSDEGALLFVILLPLAYPLLYSWIYNNEVVREVPVAVVGLLGAVIGCIVSTRLMQYFICKEYPSFKEQDAVVESHAINENQEETDNGQKAPETGFVKVLNALLDGGKSGVEIGLAIIPGVLVISTFVMMITFGGSTVTDASGNRFAG